MSKAKVIQLVSVRFSDSEEGDSNYLTALCDDGTIWEQHGSNLAWVQTKLPPNCIDEEKADES